MPRLVRKIDASAGMVHPATASITEKQIAAVAASFTFLVVTDLVIGIHANKGPERFVAPVAGQLLHARDAQLVTASVNDKLVLVGVLVVCVRVVANAALERSTTSPPTDTNTRPMED